eukprot:Skav229044  [mRNA]  locus=scaffold2828:46115:50628:+ [translate_table: standard]
MSWSQAGQYSLLVQAIEPGGLLGQEYSLGVTQLLDDLLGKDEHLEDRGLPFTANDYPGLLTAIGTSERAMRRTFQRTEEFCDEAQKYMDLLAKEEADARREADEKRKKAERRWGLTETTDAFNRSSDSFFDATWRSEALRSAAINCPGEHES